MNKLNPVKTHHEDFSFMQQALQLAEDGLGRVAPNPSVGCVIVKNGEIIGQARTADYGRPHAETQALDIAGEQAQGATLYVSLEPCANHGETKPCMEALIKAGVARVVIACRDPEQQGNGGLKKLEDAGIEVSVGVCEEQARALNEGFFKRTQLNRPFVTVKIATTLDGRIATSAGESQWITGEQARQKSHEFRAAYDAVLVGVGTVLADDPLLNVRLPEHDFQPVRIVIDRDLKTPPESKLVQSAKESPVWIVSTQSMQGEGVEMIPMEADQQGHFDVGAMLKTLSDKGLTRLYVEGGGATITEFLKAGLVDRLVWFRAPKLIGGDGVPAFQGLGIENMDEIFHFTLEDQMTLGEDFLEIWRLKG